MLKVFRVRKLLLKLSKLNTSATAKAIYQIFFWVFFLFVYTHIVACFMWYFYKRDAHWIPAVDFGMISSRVHLTYEDRPELADNEMQKFFY